MKGLHLTLDIVRRLRSQLVTVAALGAIVVGAVACGDVSDSPSGSVRTTTAEQKHQQARGPAGVEAEQLYVQALVTTKGFEDWSTSGLVDLGYRLCGRIDSLEFRPLQRDLMKNEGFSTDQALVSVGYAERYLCPVD